MTSSIAAVLSGSLSFSPSGAWNTRFTVAAAAGFPSSGNSSTTRLVVSIVGVSSISKSPVNEPDRLNAAPTEAARITTQAMITLQLWRNENNPSRYKNFATLFALPRLASSCALLLARCGFEHGVVRRCWCAHATVMIKPMLLASTVVDIKKADPWFKDLLEKWRWRRDSNPRLGVTQQTLSRRSPSAARTRHRR